MTHDFQPGDIVQTVLAPTCETMPHASDGIVPGMKVKIGSVKRNDLVQVHFLPDDRIPGHIQDASFIWNRAWFAPLSDEEQVEAPAVPLIDFSLDRYKSARLYAEYAASRTLPDEANEVFRAVAAGEVVNALDLNSALAHGFSAAATRYGQSPARRQATKELRHLHYIVQATLSNAVKGLPPIEPGTRSPRIAELEAEVDRLKAQESLTAKALDDARAEIDAQVTERERVSKVADSVVEECDRQTKDLLQRIANQRSTIQNLGAASDDFAAALDYAKTFLTEARWMQVVGFIDGRNSGRKNDED